MKRSNCPPFTVHGFRRPRRQHSCQHCLLKHHPTRKFRNPKTFTIIPTSEIPVLGFDPFGDSCSSCLHPDTRQRLRLRPGGQAEVQDHRAREDGHHGGEDFPQASLRGPSPSETSFGVCRLVLPNSGLGKVLGTMHPRMVT